ncbi:hypothetical protein FPJ23_24140, partial [Pseudomonas aeruginosa]
MHAHALIWSGEPMNRSALDFRHFVDHLRRQGDLVDVHTEVDANLEIGAITRRVYE